MALRRSWLTYLLLFAVFLISFVAASCLPLPTLFRGLITTPGVLGLLGLVHQIWRDQRMHERAVERQTREQDFALSIASHMAEVTFDKHVDFCEAYIRAMRDGLSDLFTTGPAPHALKVADALHKVRSDFVAWLSPEIDAKLEPLERALRKIGAGAHLMETMPAGERRKKLVEDIFESLGIVHGLEAAKTDEQQQIAASTVLERLRELLGIRELTTLRQKSLQSAMRRVNGS